MSLGVGCANTHEHVNRIEILMSKHNGRVKRDDTDARFTHIAICDRVENVGVRVTP